MTTKKCTKKDNARAQLLFCQSKPIAFLPSSLIKLSKETSYAAEIETVVAVIIVFCILHAYYMQLKHINYIVILDWGWNAKLGEHLPKSGDYGNWVWAILWREDDSCNKGIMKVYEGVASSIES